ncbi:LLM class flavin-dependent oxidoreductase [Microbacterium sp. X-17]|uniref:LLM class flavin-dependent oxidoreductase n=1 Tax=Microbacterium sp. X-17 TaxID=3144404 RepID=UPI0031F56550
MTNEIRFGYFQTMSQSPGESIHTAIQRGLAESIYAEELGMDDLWVTDLSGQLSAGRIGGGGTRRGIDDNGDPVAIQTGVPGFQVLAWLAARTRRIRLGTAIVPTPLRHPISAAAEAVSLDHISEGRFDLGFGRGISGFFGPDALEKMAVGKVPIPTRDDLAAYKAQYYEAIDCATGIINDTNFSYRGTYYDFHDYTLLPRPFQEPSIPMWSVAQSADTYPEIGKRGLHLMIPLPGWHGGPTWEITSAALADYRAEWTKAGHTGTPQVAVRTPTFIHENRDHAREIATRAWAETRRKLIRTSQLLAAQYDTETAPNDGALLGTAGFDNIYNPDVPIDVIVDTMCVWGTPDMAKDQFERVREELGATSMMIECQLLSSTDREDHVRTLRLIAEQIMPVFR